MDRREMMLSGLVGLPLVGLAESDDKTKGFIVCKLNVGNLSPHKAQAFIDRVGEKLAKKKKEIGIKDWVCYTIGVRDKKQVAVEVYQLDKNGNAEKVKPLVDKAHEEVLQSIIDRNDIDVEQLYQDAFHLPTESDADCLFEEYFDCVVKSGEGYPDLSMPPIRNRQSQHIGEKGEEFMASVEIAMNIRIGKWRDPSGYVDDFRQYLIASYGHHIYKGIPLSWTTICPRFKLYLEEHYSKVFPNSETS